VTFEASKLTVSIVMLRPAKLVEAVVIMRKRKRTERQREGEREKERLYLEQCQCETDFDIVHDASLRLPNEHVKQGMPFYGWKAVEGLI